MDGPMNESGAKRTVGAAVAVVTALGLMTGCGTTVRAAPGAR
ncbi:hypothetical protein [Streptomyces hygroscopicus]